MSKDAGGFRLFTELLGNFSRIKISVIMKHYFFILTATLMISRNCSAQKKIIPPAAVEKAFAHQFPGTSTRWSKEGKTAFEADFIVAGTNTSAVYSATGVLLETEKKILITELPKTARDYILLHYKQQKIDEAARITRASGEINYEAEIKGKDVLFDKAGNFIKTVKD